MLSAVLAAALAALTTPEAPLAVIAVDAASAPAPELVEMTHQLRAACRDRAPAVQDVLDTRARLLGDRSSSSLVELERAYAGAMLTAAQGDPAGAARTLRGIVAELERGPESSEAFALWTRAQLRVAHSELAAGRAGEYRESLDRLAEVDPRVRADPDQYSPTFRRDLEAARARVASRPQHELRISVARDVAATAAPAVFVDGRPAGTAPASLRVSAGRHRIGATSGALRVPAVLVDVGPGGADVTLEVGLAAAVNVNAGPSIALAAADREAAIVKVGAWVDAGRVLATSVEAEAGGSLLVGSLYDVPRGTLLREGRVRTAAGLAPPEHVAALATFLLTGQPSAAVLAAGATPAAPTPIDLSVARAPAVRGAWMRPATLGSAASAVAAGAFGLHQLLAARGHSRDAEALLRADGAILGDVGAYARHRRAESGARRNAWIGAAGTAVFAATAGVLGYLSWERGAPVVRF
jgi:hypothetical protein